jgi:hypothetical protein
MDENDQGAYAQLWLSELGAHVPEYHDGGTVAPRERGFGLHLPEHERARRHGSRLDRERGARRA